MSTGEVAVPAQSKPAPAPGAESVGPPLTDLVRELGRAAQGLEQLYRNARFAAVEQLYTGVGQEAADANGDAAIHLFQVPQGATGHLVLACVDEQGVTPGSPDTSANLWHAIYGASGTDLTQAQVVAGRGNMLDQSPSSPAADAQIPFTYLYAGLQTCPTVVGPASFWLVVDAATASSLIVCRWQVYVRRLEP